DADGARPLRRAPRAVRLGARRMSGRRDRPLSPTLGGAAADRARRAQPGRAGFAHARFISAGAGSGKTYRLTEELERALVHDGIAPARVIGTTFTVKAAAELRERVRERLIASGRIALAEQTAQALIGTVHSVSERLLRRFAFELGLSPELS